MRAGPAIKAGMAAAACTLALIVAGAPASAATTTVAIEGANAPGPRQYDRVFVTKVGPRSADRVLVLVPGFIGGAGDLTLVARDLVDRVPNLQVWGVDRRTQAFEDTSVFEQALGGEATGQDALDYYLGWIGDDSIQPHYQPLDEDAVPFVRRWGLEVALRDLRHVVRKAGKRGREVVLGGHSLGASTTVAYASWDFGGRPGFRDIDGMVLIDGGLLGSFDAFDRTQAEQALAELAQGSPFSDLLGLGLPWVAGPFAEVGALFAKLDPTGASVLQQFPLLPPEFKAPVRATNRAALGYAFDADTSPDSLELIQVRAGQLAPSGDPRDWQDGEVTPIARVADTFAQEPANGVEWYFPDRLRIDVNGADELRRNRVANFLDLRLWHTRRVDVPLYAFQTSLTDGDVLRGAERFVRRSSLRRRDVVLEDRTSTTSHLDPLTAAPRSNDFLKTVIPFLRDAF
jgi:hypothetical protein